jgi:hypothetical protein
MRKPFCKDRTSAGSIVTRETANGKMKPNRTSCAGNICEVALILTRDEVREISAVSTHDAYLPVSANLFANPQPV